MSCKLNGLLLFNFRLEASPELVVKSNSALYFVPALRAVEINRQNFVEVGLLQSIV